MSRPVSGHRAGAVHSFPTHMLCSRVAWDQVPSVPDETQDKPPGALCLGFLTCRVGVIVVPASEGCFRNKVIYEALQTVIGTWQVMPWLLHNEASI